MVRKNLLRSVSVIMACMMAVLTVACGSNTATTENGQATAVVETAKEQQLEKSLANSASALGAIGEAGKVETVYVTADANGAVNDVIVSEWLKNAEQSAELSDTTELHDIVNVKGSETYTENGDGTVTWNAEGSDIYYQGTTDKELPVDMKITYTLDGKEISPSELAGKSGKVTIRFEYENKSKQTVNVDGKDVEVYTPFAMVSGMMLDSDKFSNVEISNGKVISEGNNYIVMGVALPGLKESLDISDEKWDELEDSEEIKGKLSNSFEITADTTDFELGMTITMASSDILSDFGAMDIADSSKIDDLKDDMGELNDGSTKLVEGAGTLKDGTGKLAEGSKELKDGTGKLYDGTKELKDGTTKLSDGTGKLADGAGQLSDGAGTLANGTGTLKDGTGKLADGSKTLTDGVSSYTSGVSQVNAGATMLSNGTETLVTGTGKVSAGAAKLQAGAGQLAAGTEELNNGVSQLSQLSSALDMISAKKTALETKKAELDTTASGLNAVEGFLTTPGVPCPDALVPTLTQLSGGKIQSAEDAVRVRDAGLAALAGQQSGEVHQEPAGAENAENEVVSGEIPNPDSKSSTENVVEITAASGAATSETTESTPSNEPAENREETSGQQGAAPADGAGSPAAAAESTTAATTAATTVNNASASVEIKDEATPKTASVASDTGSDEKIYSQKDVDDMVDQLVKEKLEEAVKEYVTSDEYKAAAAAKMEETVKAEVTKRVKQEVASRVSDISAYSATLAATRATKNAVSETLTFVNDTLASFDAFVTDQDKAYGINTFEKKLDLTKQKLIDLQGGVAKLNAGAQELNTGATQLKAGIDGYNMPDGTHVTGLSEGVAQVNAGAKQIKAGTDQLVANNDKLNGGAKQVSDGAAQLDSGAAQLKDGADKLATGAKDLKSGADELNTGAGTLDNGATELMNGAKDLNDGAGKLDEGIGKVDAGVQELLDGITKLDQEGIKKLYEAFDGDLTDFVDKLTAIKEAGTEYTSFAGASDEEDCSVKFIIRTAGVKAEDI
ncbi:hypothetical protein [Butyrivibrio sp. INlla14]|uniref:hypothetical protein n=1 Tax=Butyrivibrio sp. INlla14 TaxID=1520808 RepID=UPI000876B70E|nr:hypothetical protein [Butyrivibrio sp. INlla14]SCY46910.1 putative membrane protein [Butyrivibrio sp. INlla14]